MNNFIRSFLIVLSVSLASPASAQFRATGTSTETALSRIRNQAAGIKSYMQRQRVLMAAATVDSRVPLAVIDYLKDAIPMLTALASTPGLAEYARGQLNDPNYDIVAEFTAMRAALINLRNNLVSTFPTLGGTGIPPTGGFLAYEQLDATGTKTTRTFNAAQMATAVGFMDAVIASIQ